VRGVWLHAQGPPSRASVDSTSQRSSADSGGAYYVGTTCTVSTPLQEVVVARVEAMVPLFAGE